MNDFSLLLLRVAAGGIFFAHGWNHARNLAGTANWFASKGFRLALWQARMSVLVEIGAGLLLVVGLLTPVAAAGLVGTMVVAGWAIHRFNGFFVFRPGEGWEYVGLLGVVGLVIAVSGPGAVSLDAVLGLDLAGWPGGLIGAGGVVAGVLQLAAFWRRPTG